MHPGIQETTKYDDDNGNEQTDEDALHHAFSRVRRNGRIVRPCLVDHLARRLNLRLIQQELLTFGEHGQQQAFLDLFLALDGTHFQLLHRHRLDLGVCRLSSLRSRKDTGLKLVEV